MCNSIFTIEFIINFIEALFTYFSESFNNLPLKFDISHKDRSLKIYLKGGFLWKYEVIIVKYFLYRYILELIVTHLI